MQCLDCMHDQPHLTVDDGRVVPVEDRWERMVAGKPYVASCTVTIDQDQVETCSGPDAADSLTFGSLGRVGTREFFTHVRFHKHDEERIVVHLLVELYARTEEEAIDVLEERLSRHAGDHLAGGGVAPARARGRRSPLNNQPVASSASREPKATGQRRSRLRGATGFPVGRYKRGACPASAPSSPPDARSTQRSIARGSPTSSASTAVYTTHIAGRDSLTVLMAVRLGHRASAARHRRGADLLPHARRDGADRGDDRRVLRRPDGARAGRLAQDHGRELVRREDRQAGDPDARVRRAS